MIAFELLFQKEVKYLLYGGAGGGGKSYFLRWCALALGIYYTNTYRESLEFGTDEYGRKKYRTVPIGLFSEDYPTLKDRQIIKIREEFPEWLGNIKETRDEGLVFKPRPQYGNFVIMLRNLDDASKYASTEFAAILVEELTKNIYDTFHDLRFRLRFPGISDPKFVAATNPGEIGHAWVKKLWIDPDVRNLDPESERFYFVPAKVYDNPVLSSDGNYIKQLESLPPKKRKAVLDGSWDIFAGQVLSEWSNRTHVVDPFIIPSSWRRFLAMDYGTNKPFAVGWYTVNPDGRTYLYRELYMNGDGFEAMFGAALTPKRLARVIMKINQKSDEDYEYCVADPAMWNDAIQGKKSNKSLTSGESVAEQMIRVGLKMKPADNDRQNGLERYREALSIAPDGKPWYQVFRTCYDTYRTIPALVYPKTGANVEDVDTDAEDHCYDRDRYFFMSRPSKPRSTTPRDTENLLRRHFILKKKQYERQQRQESYSR